MLNILLCFTLLFCSLSAAEPVEFVVVIPSYNNEAWCIKNLETVASQSYPHWSIIYINDCSTDKTGMLVENYIKEKGLQAKCRVIHNATRLGAMANYYAAISSCQPNKVIATLDGDDRLAHNQVLERIADVYRDKKIWATHGNYTTEPFKAASYCTAYPKTVEKKNSFRKHLWLGCQLRTFYAKLFHKIKKKDLMWKKDFLPMASDLAFMMPILEMASNGHTHFIEEPIYIVNTANPLSDIKTDGSLQKKLDEYVRSHSKYKPLKRLF